MKNKIQFIEKSGQPEWAIIPYSEYQKLVKMYDFIDDTALFLQATRSNLISEALPHEIVKKLVNGENPVRVIRQYQGQTIDQLAQEVNITQSYLSQIETSKKQASQKTLKLLALKLKVDVQDLIS